MTLGEALQEYSMFSLRRELQDSGKKLFLNFRGRAKDSSVPETFHDSSTTFIEKASGVADGIDNTWKLACQAMMETDFAGDVDKCILAITYGRAISTLKVWERAIAGKTLVGARHNKVRRELDNAFQSLEEIFGPGRQKAQIGMRLFGFWKTADDIDKVERVIKDNQPAINNINQQTAQLVAMAQKCLGVYSFIEERINYATHQQGDGQNFSEMEQEVIAYVESYFQNPTKRLRVSLE